ncbi:MAG: enoyl-CoA hydratase/isomerase [Parachlamydiaceae bacterium]|nr:enoyl-CoA hydratase/isomerase [Parachlamydiaceae bacterium]
MGMRNYETIKVQKNNPICQIQFNRPEAKNTINDLLIQEIMEVLDNCIDDVSVVVFEGLPDYFCYGADFNEVSKEKDSSHSSGGPEPLYNIWLKMATGPFITISHVRGKVNAGGMGFVAASDIVLADETAQFSLSELIFGLMPACVMPFLIRKIGFQKAHYLTLSTQPIGLQQAYQWGLVDAYDSNSESLLRKQLLRLRRLPKSGIAKYKNYIRTLMPSLDNDKNIAIETNKEIFSDPQNIAGISRFVKTGQFPWEN